MSEPCHVPASRRMPIPRPWLALAALPAAVVFGGWYLTEPLESPSGVASLAAPRDTATGAGTAVPDLGTPAPPPAPAAASDPAPTDETTALQASPDPSLAWPDGSLEGEPAKRLLLRALLVAQERLQAVDGYTATFRKQERIRGELRPLQTMAMKVRHEPFSIYLKFLAPKEGKEVIYCDGRFDNHMIGHNGDWSRLLVPRLKVAPTDALALVDNRHPITDAGLRNLVDKLISFRHLDLRDAEAETVLDRVSDESDRTWLRSLHTHPHHSPERPFARVEVLYDPETLIPHRITSYDWPEPGHAGELLLGECYVYDDVDLEADLDDTDFDPANPAYAFTRF